MTNTTIITFLFLWVLAISLPAFAQDSVVIVQLEKPLTIMLDPGHGGRDPGNPNGIKDGKNEKNLNLLLAQKVGRYMEDRIGGLTVLYTRDSDKTVSLDERVEIANASGADFFISIHCNWVSHRRLNGVQLHIQDHNFKTSSGLAVELNKQFTKRAGRKSYGILARADRGYNYQVLQYTQMPGVLIECGFMSNPTEERYLNSDYGQDILASAIFRAFRNFVTEPQQPAPDDRSIYYKVQIMASTQMENPIGERYRKLNARVEEFLDSSGTSYKYRYLIAREYEREVAEQIAQDAQKNGFEGAFVVVFDGTQPTNLVSTKRYFN